LETSLVRLAADQSSLHPVAGLPLGARCLVGLVEDQHARLSTLLIEARVKYMKVYAQWAWVCIAMHYQQGLR
jgi:hypothetical protein